MRVHVFNYSGEAYDASQMRDQWFVDRMNEDHGLNWEPIEDGDVLVAEHDRVVGYLYEAWPVAVTQNAGSFHRSERPGPMPEHDDSFDRALIEAENRQFVISEEALQR